MEPNLNNGESTNCELYAAQLESVTFGYDKKSTVLDNCTLRIKEGEIFALLGSNGCGKTTILKLILGRAKPRKGLVRVFGLQPGEKKSNIPGPGVGFMPQEIALFPDFTVEENILYFAKLFRISDEVFEERFKYLTQLLNLCERNRRVENMSGGEQRLVSMAVAIIHRPKLIILDEPTVGVDSILRTRIWKYLEDSCRDSGNTVIITTHYIEEAKRASNVGFMKSGSIMRQSNPQELIDEYQCKTLEDVFHRLWQQKDNKSIVSKMDSNSNAFNKLDDNNQRKSNYSLKIMDIHKVSALLWKGYKRANRLRLFMLCYIGIPIISLLTLYLCTGHLHYNIPVAVYLEEPWDVLSNRFINLIDTRFLNIIQYESKESAIDSLFEGKNVFAIYFAKNFSDEFESKLLNPFDINGDDSFTIKVTVDNSRGMILVYGIQYLAQVFDKFSTNVSISLGLTSNFYSLPMIIEQPAYGVHPITGKDTDISRVDYDHLLPGVLILILHILSMVFSAFFIINNRRGCQMGRYYVTGGQPIELIVAQYMTIMAYSGIQIFMILIIATYLLDIKQEGSYFEVYLMCFLESLQGLSIGMLIALVFKSEFAIMTVAILLNFPMFCMSGIFWPLEGITYIRSAADWTPITKPIDSLRSIMTRGWDYNHPNVMNGYIFSLSYTVVISIMNVLIFQINQESVI